jgi:hypothetical protein
MDYIMEIVGKITREEFIQDCINKIQTGRMLSVSALFNPFRNARGFLPEVKLTDIKNIGNMISAVDKEKAKSIFTEICQRRFDIP